MGRSLKVLLLVLALLVGGAGFATAQELPQAGVPVVMTCPGQAPEISIARMLFQRAGLDVAAEAFLEADALEGYNTLVIILGASGKGLGEAGVDLGDEVRRGNDLVAAAKEQGVKLLGFHLGGMARMGAYSHRVMDEIAGAMDHIVVRQDADEDGYFTALAEEGVPITFIERSLDLQDILVEIFSEE